MDPERTTTMGEGESAITDKPFHIMKAVERIRPKLRIWAAACRGFWRAESMLGVEGPGASWEAFEGGCCEWNGLELRAEEIFWGGRCAEDIAEK
jgi:hypothetical protein